MIAVICLHPAIDRTLELPMPLEVGGLNRATVLGERAGGKGINVASVLTTLGAKTCVILPQAGMNGRRLEQLLQKQNISSFKISVLGETRECQAMLYPGFMPTEVVESGPRLEPADMGRLEALIPDLASWLILSGSLAPGLTAQEFGAWVGKLSRRFRVVVDTSGEALRAAIENGAYLIKPNSSELGQLGMNAMQIFERFGTRVLHSRGSDGLFYTGPEGQFFQEPHQIEVINPVGAGDATLAGFIDGFERLDSINDSLRFANACGAAACLEPVAGMVRVDRVQSLLEVAHA
jgi:tagatose 6-phosphate kinase